VEPESTGPGVIRALGEDAFAVVGFLAEARADLLSGIPKADASQDAGTLID
jgi:hypothetical protein